MYSTCGSLYYTDRPLVLEELETPHDRSGVINDAVKYLAGSSSAQYTLCYTNAAAEEKFFPCQEYDGDECNYEPDSYYGIVSSSLETSSDAESEIAYVRKICRDNSAFRDCIAKDSEGFRTHSDASCSINSPVSTPRRQPVTAVPRARADEGCTQGNDVSSERVSSHPPKKGYPITCIPSDVYSNLEIKGNKVTKAVERSHKLDININTSEKVNTMDKRMFNQRYLSAEAPENKLRPTWDNMKTRSMSNENLVSGGTADLMNFAKDFRAKYGTTNSEEPFVSSPTLGSRKNYNVHAVSDVECVDPMYSFAMSGRTRNRNYAHSFKSNDNEELSFRHTAADKYANSNDVDNDRPFYRGRMSETVEDLEHPFEKLPGYVGLRKPVNIQKLGHTPSDDILLRDYKSGAQQGVFTEYNKITSPIGVEERLRSQSYGHGGNIVSYDRRIQIHSERQHRVEPNGQDTRPGKVGPHIAGMRDFRQQMANRTPEVQTETFGDHETVHNVECITREPYIRQMQHLYTSHPTIEATTISAPIVEPIGTIAENTPVSISEVNRQIDTYLNSKPSLRMDRGDLGNRRSSVPLDSKREDTIQFADKPKVESYGYQDGSSVVSTNSTKHFHREYSGLSRISENRASTVYTNLDKSKTAIATPSCDISSASITPPPGMVSYANERVLKEDIDTPMQGESWMFEIDSQISQVNSVSPGITAPENFLSPNNDDPCNVVIDNSKSGDVNLYDSGRIVLPDPACAVDPLEHPSNTGRDISTHYTTVQTEALTKTATVLERSPADYELSDGEPTRTNHIEGCCEPGTPPSRATMSFGDELGSYIPGGCLPDSAFRSSIEPGIFDGDVVRPYLESTQEQQPPLAPLFTFGGPNVKRYSNLSYSERGFKHGSLDARTNSFPWRHQRSLDTMQSDECISSRYKLIKNGHHSSIPTYTHNYSMPSDAPGEECLTWRQRSLHPSDSDVQPLNRHGKNSCDTIGQFDFVTPKDYDVDHRPLISHLGLYDGAKREILGRHLRKYSHNSSAASSDYVRMPSDAHSYAKTRCVVPESVYDDDEDGIRPAESEAASRGKMSLGSVETLLSQSVDRAGDLEPLVALVKQLNTALEGQKRMETLKGSVPIVEEGVNVSSITKGREQLDTAIQTVPNDTDLFRRQSVDSQCHDLPHNKVTIGTQTVAMGRERRSSTSSRGSVSVSFSMDAADDAAYSAPNHNKRIDASTNTPSQFPLYSKSVESIYSSPSEPEGYMNPFAKEALVSRMTGSSTSRSLPRHNSGPNRPLYTSGDSDDDVGRAREEAVSSSRDKGRPSLSIPEGLTEEELMEAYNEVKKLIRIFHVKDVKSLTRAVTARVNRTSI
ncbi:uncharacterized protein BXIN_1654 [Babesia sp. Xinjiang]|uniref:uncharacterized protein n=1 Tax=Babesia sp. Xinjiang TaxID=462227 RepID=UPI000A21B668|nr:uncharacterized protein BXIN_1654 [Babesia sp. Xinjiang]ORM40873.1 hypothetical protein BXIN_1654 [Babesia sp. Xinjiang]